MAVDFEVVAALPERLKELLGGPGHLRFIVQPLIAILLGIRDGRLDARAGKEPYIFAVLFGGAARKASIESGVAAFIKPFAVAVIIDMLLQFYILRDVRIWSALVVGTFLVAVPYSIARALTNRVVKRRGGRGRPVP